MNKLKTLSKKYKVISTDRISEKLINDGYQITARNIVNCRNKDNQPFAKHLIRFRKIGIEEYQGNVPEIILINSYDGKSSYKLMLGIYRFACANGLIVGSTMSDIKIRHVGSNARRFVSASNKLLKKSENVFKIINKWQGVRLEEKQKESYIDMIKEEFNADYKRLDGIRRHSDNINDLWTTFNRIQENIMKGNCFKRIPNGYWQKSREVKSIDNKVKINRSLWDVTDRFYKGFNRN